MGVEEEGGGVGEGMDEGVGGGGVGDDDSEGGGFDSIRKQDTLGLVRWLV